MLLRSLPNSIYKVILNIICVRGDARTSNTPIITHKECESARVIN